MKRVSLILFLFAACAVGILLFLFAGESVEPLVAVLGEMLEGASDGWRNGRS